MWNTIIAAAPVITASILFIVTIVGVIGLFRGGWKAIKQFSNIAKKGNLFIDNIFPELLNHLCKTKRAPSDSLTKWTQLISGEALKYSSPLQITDTGNALITKIGLEAIFNENKEQWINKLKQSGEYPQNKYDLEASCISFGSSLFSEDSSFDSVKNYLYEHPTETNAATIYALVGVLLRNYILEKHPEMVK